MKQLFSVLAFFFLLVYGLAGQSSQKFANDKALQTIDHECATDEYRALLFSQQPARRAAQERLEKLAAKQLRSGSFSQKMPLYTLPVVFHIIHQNGPENITDAQVLAGLQNLNDAFANINFYDQNNGVDTEIEFCLATQDPAGNATTGINRVVSPLTDVNFGSDVQMKDLSRWDPTQYINIWLVRSINGGGVAGYAYFPSSHGGPEDGIVMLGSIVPNLGGGHATLVHEMGHYFGLYHTFEGGCTNNDCLTDGDRVCDTPPDGTTAPPGNCTAIVNSCSTDANSGFATDQNDINWNYVDYGNHACRSGYTQGQTDRMHFFIENARQSLLNSTACQDPCLSPIVASFNASATAVNVGATVNFTNSSTGGTGYVWQINGTNFAASQNANYTFNSEGSFEITLLASNADPNCQAEFSLTVTVTCPVNASFSTSDLYPAPGEQVVFTNTSTGGGTTYQWTVDGTVVSSATNFSSTFASTGQHTVCLESSNGGCADEFCQLVFVINDSGGSGCDGTFLQLLGDIGLSEFAHTLLVTPEGNLMVGGNHGEDAMLALITPGGELLWARNFDFLTNSEFIFEIMLDSDGQILAVGRNQLNANTVNFIFKYDYQNDNVLWSRRMTNPALTRLEILLEKAPGDNYFILGMSDNNNIFMEIDRNTGAAVNMEDYHFGQTDNFLGAFVHNSEIYAVGVQRNGGLGDIRASMTKLDFSGNQIWTRFYFNPLPQNARTYFYETLLENDTIVAYGRGDLNGQSFTDVEILLMKSDLDGNFLSAKRYDFPTSTTEFSGSLVALPDGYLLQGTHVPNSTGISEYFLLRVDKQGNIVWAKSVRSVGSDWGKYAAVHDGFIYFIGQSFEVDGAGDLLFGKMSLDGEVVSDGCEFVTDLNVVAGNVTDQYDGQHLLTQSNVNYSLNGFAQNPTSITLGSGYLPTCECPDPPTSCNETFVTAYGSNQPEEGRKLVAVPGGWAFTASKTDSLIVGMFDESGNLLWQQSMNFSNGLTERARDMMLTSDGHLLICGSTVEGALNSWDNFALKFDYQNQTLLWAKTFDYGPGDRSVLVNVTEHPVNGNYIVSGDTAPNNAPGLGCDALWMELNPANGNTVSVRNFNLGSCETFIKPILASDGSGFYATGRYNAAGGGTDKFRPPITKLDLNGNELWTRLYLRNVSNQNARLYGYSIIEENNGLFVFGNGDLNGTSTGNVTLQIFKTDLQGNIDWAKTYDLPGATFENVIEAISLPDGFLVLGNFIQGDQDIFLLKVDKQGNVQWARAYGDTANESANDLDYQNGQIFIFGKTISFGAGSDDILLLKLDLNGEIQDDACVFSADLSPVQADLQNPYDGSHPLTAWTPNYPTTNASPGLFTPPLEPTQLCFTPCEPDTCANGLPVHTMPDAVLEAASGQCAGDSILVTLELCNADSVALPAGTPISFYQNNPTAVAATLLTTVTLPSALAPGACASLNFPVVLPTNQQIFVVANDDGNTPTPFDLASDFPNTGTQECDFTNNLASFTVDFTPPLLQLGPDITICHFEVTPLDAGPGFASYQWSNGTNEQATTAWEPGTYTVTVTDACGGTQTDQLTITVDPGTIVEIGVDSVLLCEGDSVQFAVSGFTSYQWFPPELVDCPDCPSVTAFPQTDTCLILVAGNSDGCYSADTVCIQVLPTANFTDTIGFCQGDTVLVFGQPVTQPGEYSMVFAAQNGCDSTVTITLFSQGDTVLLSELASICQGEAFDFFGQMLTAPGTYDNFDNSSGCTIHNMLELSVLDTFFTTESLSICQGGSVLIFGNPTSAPGDYSMVFAAQNGCDSTHTISLTVLDTAATSEVIEICESETADIFGTPTNVPGTYSMAFQTLGGCDSAHTITLLVNDTFDLAETLSICDGDSVLVFGNWVNEAGVFSETFQTASGCDSTVTITVLVGNSAQTSEAVQICESETADIFGTPTNVAGTYSMVFAAQNGCDSTHSITLTVLDTVQTAETLEICENEMADIFGTLTNVAGTYSEVFAAQNGCDSTHAITLLVNDTALVAQSIFICPGDSVLIFGNFETQAGTYSEVFAAQNGCDSTVVVELSVGLEMALSFTANPACEGLDNGQLTVEVSGGTPPLSYNWSYPGAPNSPVLIDLPPGSFSLTVTDGNGCTATATGELPLAGVLDFSIISTDVGCAGEATGSIEVVSAQPGLLFSLDGGSFQPEPFFGNLPAGNYELQVTDPATGCSATANVAIDEGQAPFLLLPPDVTIELGEALTIQSTTFQDSLAFAWLPDLWLSCADCPNPLSQPEETTLYTLTVSDLAGCEAVDSILISVVFTPSVYVPNAFSPNGDGINDRFTVFADGVAEVRLLRIFDRWGEMVYEGTNLLPNDTSLGWDGSFRGKPMDPAVFAWFAEVRYLDGSTGMLEGDVTLVR